ncbi:MAG: hypothetical protein ACERKN_17115 [Velocimicrobium sp.]
MGKENFPAVKKTDQLNQLKKHRFVLLNYGSSIDSVPLDKVESLLLWTPLFEMKER